MKIQKTLKIKVFAILLLVLYTVLCFSFACFTRKEATYVNLDKSEVTLCVGESVILSVETDGFGIKWSSDAVHVATVDDGEITALGEGEATIKVSVGKVKAYCEVTVIKQSTEAGATYIKLSYTEATLYEGDVLTVTAQTDGTKNIEWKSDAPEIATVNNGVITAVAAGKANIEASTESVKANCLITVVKKEENPNPEPPVKQGDICDIYSDYFVIGAAVQTGKLTGGGYGELINHFNSITPENNMKWKNIEKSEGVYNFNQSGDSSDKMINWAKSNGAGVRGHCLLWYKSLPEWLHDKFDGVVYSENVKNSAYSYIDKHIETVMKHFGDDVYVWDVVNEALFNSVNEDNLSVSAGNPYGDIWRTKDNMNATESDWVDWFKVTGGYEYIARAFKKADEVRKANNLNVELYYNDYALNNPYKRQACLNLIKMLRDNNAPIDGIGMQAHYKLAEYTANRVEWIKNFENSVKAFIDAGLDVQITELDIRFDGALTLQTEADQAEMYGKIFEVCRKYAKKGNVEHGITGVTLWGVYDGCNQAWGADKYPLIFGTDKLPKKAYYEIINF